MSIPKFTEDLKIIQKLSDLPNSTEGLTAAELKAKFDYAPIAVQKFINEQLVPNIKAEQIPFTATNEILASTIYDAILNVQSQVKEAAAGVIANGSVGKEKLSDDLLERVYGGRPWVALDTPSSTHNVAAGFPIGQLWLRPSYTVTNEATTTWTKSACNVSTSGHNVTITGTKTAATATATQTISNLGVEGDRIFVVFDVTNKDSEITNMSLSLNGTEKGISSVGYYTSNLTGTSLVVKFSVTWPATSLADGSVTIKNFGVVNVTKILRQLTDAKDRRYWGDYLRSLQPMDTYTSDAEVFIHTSDGKWWPFGFDTLAVSRGGTGLNSVKSGALLVGAGSSSMKVLSPGTNGAMLQLASGQPTWVVLDYEEILSSLGFLRSKTGSYKGTSSKNTVTLSVAPKLLRIFGVSGTGSNNDGPTTDQFIRSGETISMTTYQSGGAYTSYIKLSKKELSFYAEAHINPNLEYEAKYMNLSGNTYQWFALY